MKVLLHTATAVLATVSLSACGSGRTADSNAQSDVAANEAGASTAVERNPFVDAEKQMSGAMMAAVGSNAGQNWALKMIAHHQGAIEMSKIVLEHNPTADVAKMAREDIDKQTTDIASIRKLLQDGAPDRKSAALYRDAMSAMEHAMMAAGGADVSETYLRKMLAHHQGAVAMSDVALQAGVSGAMQAQVEKTKTENRNDAAMVEAMLSGKPMNMSDKNMSGNMSGMDMKGMDMNAMNHM